MSHAKNSGAKKTTQSGVRPDLARIADQERAWWADFPATASFGLSVAFAPFRALIMLSELLVSLAFAALLLTLFAWWTGYISDATVADWLAATGERILRIIAAAGLF